MAMLLMVRSTPMVLPRRARVQAERPTIRRPGGGKLTTKRSVAAGSSLRRTGTSAQARPCGYRIESASLLPQTLDRLQHVFAVLSRVDLRVLVDNLAVLADDKGPALDGHAALEGMVLAIDLGAEILPCADRHAELPGHVPLLVRQKREGQLVVFLEEGVRLGGVAADAHDLDAFVGELLEVVTERTGLLGAPARE